MTQHQFYASNSITQSERNYYVHNDTTSILHKQFNHKVNKGITVFRISAKATEPPYL